MLRTFGVKANTLTRYLGRQPWLWLSVAMVVALAARLYRLADPVLRDTLALNARAWAAQRTWERSFRGLLRAYILPQPAQTS